jgi:hypothetical protein
MNTTIAITTTITTRVFKSAEARRRKQNQPSSGQCNWERDCLSPRLGNRRWTDINVPVMVVSLEHRHLCVKWKVE